MQVGATTQARATGAAANAGDRSVINSDFQTFLEMLTTQMQNQDPLNPMDSTEFSTQLATFSGVEQQVRTNDLLSGLQQAMSFSNLGDVAGWIGREARAEMPMAFQGEPLTLLASGNALATRMELVVTDAEGQALQRVEVPVSDAPFQWAGVTSDGAPLPGGTYGFHIEYFNDDTPIDTRPAQGYATIEEVENINGEIWLTMPGGVQVRSSEITSVRDGG
ncbi:MAG: flagellar basal body rod modification protein [Rhodobacteraceae bacterium CG17_big_fil_post_rev_8_21_14_2_50_65_11]|nr:MAG: flagellar basal body rod modification protein [Rhodobacteraceae bacterium CG17_big_fil_post_rev_8_21_14_2_50_65_11]